MSDDLEPKEEERFRARSRGLYLGMVEVLDAFDRLQKAADDAAPGEEARRWIERFGKVRKRVENLLAQEKVQTVGYGQFQEELHEVVEVVQTLDHPADTILEVQAPCYVWYPDGTMRALRKAKVVVAVPPDDVKGGG